MKKELRNHLLPLLAIFILSLIPWIIDKAPWYNYIYLFFGLLWGSFFLDIDHIIYWLVVVPKLDESKIARTAIQTKDYRLLLNLLESTHKSHNNLIFHHYFFQIILTLISFFIFTSSTSIFIKAMTLALNIHLLVDEIEDYLNDPKHLQNWLFAREKRQMSLASLKYYLLFFLLTTLSFFFILLR